MHAPIIFGDVFLKKDRRTLLLCSICKTKPSRRVPLAQGPRRVKYLRQFSLLVTTVGFLKQQTLFPHCFSIPIQVRNVQQAV